MHTTMWCCALLCDTIFRLMSTISPTFPFDQFLFWGFQIRLHWWLWCTWPCWWCWCWPAWVHGGHSSDPMFQHVCVCAFSKAYVGIEKTLSTCQVKYNQNIFHFVNHLKNLNKFLFKYGHHQFGLSLFSLSLSMGYDHELYRNAVMHFRQTTAAEKKIVWILKLKAIDRFHDIANFLIPRTFKTSYQKGLC